MTALTKYKVTEVIDGSTLDVSPEWNWNDQSGNRVRLANVDAPEIHHPGGLKAKRQLDSQVARRSVELKNSISVSGGCLVCDVYVRGVKVLS